MTKTIFPWDQLICNRKSNTWKWRMERFSSQRPSTLRGWRWFYHKSICNRMYLCNLLKEEGANAWACSPPPCGPGGRHTAHAPRRRIGCLSYLLLFNLTGVDKALQRTKRVCRIIMAMKKLKILNHTSVWCIKDRPFTPGHAFLLSSNYYYCWHHAGGNIGSQASDLVHGEVINDPRNKNEGNKRQLLKWARS